MFSSNQARTFSKCKQTPQAQKCVEAAGELDDTYHRNACLQICAKGLWEPHLDTPYIARHVGKYVSGMCNVGILRNMMQFRPSVLCYL